MKARMDQDRFSKLALLRTLFILGMVALFILQFWLGKGLFDDAYITFRYARRLSEGLGFTYNSGQAVLGTTTPLYTLILALGAWMFSPAILPTFSVLLSVLMDSVNVWLMYRIANGMFKDEKIAILVAATYLLQPFRVNVASGGMETSMFMACLLGMYDRYLLGKRAPFTSVFAALAFLVRPDAVLAIAPVFLHWVVKDWKGGVRAGLFWDASQGRFWTDRLSELTAKRRESERDRWVRAVLRKSATQE